MPGYLLRRKPKGDKNGEKHKEEKAFGSYVGNNSPRTVSTNGTGNLLLAYSDAYLALVTPTGAFVVNTGTGTFEWRGMAEVHYIDGELQIENGNTPLNVSNAVYYYQVI